MAKTRCSAAVAAAMFCLAAPAQATVLRPLDLTQLAVGAETIAYGRVVEVRPEWVGPGRAIDTFVGVEVHATFKGEPRPRLTLRLPGGRIGPYLSLVPGAPELRTGDEVVLFLEELQGQRESTSLGLHQGVLPVSADATGVRTVRVPVPWSSGEAAFPPRVTVPLDDLARTLAGILAGAESHAGAGR